MPNNLVFLAYSFLLPKGTLEQAARDGRLHNADFMNALIVYVNSYLALFVLILY